MSISYLVRKVKIPVLAHFDRSKCIAGKIMTWPNLACPVKYGVLLVTGLQAFVPCSPLRTEFSDHAAIHHPSDTSHPTSASSLRARRLWLPRQPTIYPQERSRTVALSHICLLLQQSTWHESHTGTAQTRRVGGAGTIFHAACTRRP